MENGKQGAFACAAESGYQQGLTKREYFAAMAMQGIMASLTKMRANGAPPPHYTGMDEDIAIEAVAISDALLKALETKSE